MGASEYEWVQVSTSGNKLGQAFRTRHALIPTTTKHMPVVSGLDTFVVVRNITISTRQSELTQKLFDQIGCLWETSASVLLSMSINYLSCKNVPQTYKTSVTHQA